MRLSYIIGMPLKNTANPIRIVCIMGVFGVFIISNYFTAAYTSVMSIPTFKASVTSVTDLANSKTVNTFLMKGSGSDDYIMVTYLNMENSKPFIKL